MSTAYQIVFITASSPEEAERLSEVLVGEGLAACVNMIVPCRSVYRWQGKVVKDEEVLMIAKIRAQQFEMVAKRVTQLHSYDVPEIIAVNLDAASVGYQQFLESVLGGED